MLHVQQLQTVLSLHEVVQWDSICLESIGVLGQVLGIHIHVDLCLAGVGIDLIQRECLLVWVLALWELGAGGTCQNRLLKLLSLTFKHV